MCKSFFDFIWPILNSNLKNMGNLMLGVAALKGLAIGTNYLETERIKAALNIDRSFEETVKYIIEIVETPYLYTVVDYYPFKVPEVGNKNSEQYVERPARLIKNQYGILKKDLTANLGVLLPCQYDQLNKLEDKLDIIIRLIYGYLEAKLGNHPDKLALLKEYKDSSEYIDELKAILKEVKICLQPFNK